MSAWVYYTATPANGSRFISEGSQNILILQVLAGNLKASLWDGSQKDADSGISASSMVGKWFHILATSDGSTEKIYINGVLSGSISVGATSYCCGTDRSVTLGANSGGGGGFFGGKLDDVRIYNRALSASEVTQLYNLGAVNVAHSNTTSISSGLVGYWTMDGSKINWAANTMQDSSGQNNTGTLVNLGTTTSPTQGKVGQALKFNGSSSYVDLGSMTALNVGTGDFMISAWVYNTNQSTGNVLVSKDNGSTQRQLSIVANTDSGGASNPGKVRIGIFNSSGDFYYRETNGGALLTNKWTHIVVGRASGVLKLYMNGVAPTTVTGGTGIATENMAINSGSVNAEIGARHLFVGSQYYFNGIIDDVRVYNRALSASEVMALYKATK